MQVLPDPSPSFFLEFDKMSKKFVWNNKAPKIKMVLLQNTKPKGGLGLVNMETKNATLKAAWILHDDLHSQSQLSNFMPDELGTLFWDCAMTKRHVQNGLRKLF